MRKLLIASAVAMFCFMSNSFSASQSYTYVQTLGKFPKMISKGSGPLDLTSLIKTNPQLHFAIKDPNTGAITYTHNGIFYGKNDGYFYQDKKRLQGYLVPTDLTSMDCKLTDVKAPPEEISPEATSSIIDNVNLNASDSIIILPFNPNDPNTFNYKNTTMIYDSLGLNHEVAIYFVKSGMNLWTVNVYADQVAIGTGDLQFHVQGQLLYARGLNQLEFAPLSGAVTPQLLNLELNGSTQYGSPYKTREITADGMPAGDLSSYSIDNNGYFSYFYSNEQAITFSKIAVFIK